MKTNVRRLWLILGVLVLLSMTVTAKEIKKDAAVTEKTIKKEQTSKTTETVKLETKESEIESKKSPQPKTSSIVKVSFDKLVEQYESTSFLQDSVKLNWYVFPNGISMGTGNDLQLEAISGQEFVGTYISPEYHLNLGFFQSFAPASCCIGYRGNVRDGGVDDGSPYSLNIADLVRLAAFMLAGDPPPDCLAEADIDGSGQIDIADVIHLVDFMFRGGPLPALCP